MLRSTILYLFFLLPVINAFSHEPAAQPKLKIITIVVNPNGMVYMGPNTLSTADLAVQLKERLWRSYLGNDKMYDQIKIELNGEVLMGVKGAVLDAIRLAQKNALKEICIQKYKQLFENISSREQKKIRKLFPVLFQDLQW